MRQWRETVEQPFGTIKSWMGATHFCRQPTCHRACADKKELLYTRV